MKIGKHLAQVVTPLAMLVASTNSFAEEYTLITSELPPFSYKSAEGMTGIAVNVVNEMFKRAGYNYKISNQPVARAISSALKNNNQCVFPLSRSQDREASFKWVSPILIKRSGLYSLESKDLSSFYDATTNSVGVTRGSIEKEYLGKFGLKLNDTSTDEQNLKKLTAKRVEFWATDDLTMSYYTKDMSNAPVKAAHVMTSLGTLACNLSVSDEVIDKLQESLESMYADGTMAKLKAKD